MISTASSTGYAHSKGLAWYHLPNFPVMLRMDCSSTGIFMHVPASSALHGDKINTFVCSLPSVRQVLLKNVSTLLASRMPGPSHVSHMVWFMACLQLS
jgi:hypothetical protein